MNDENDSKGTDSDNKSGTPRKLQLTRTVTSGQVKQNFARGKSKTVQVEVRKTRTFSRGEDNKLIEDKPVEEAPVEKDDSGLTESEKKSRLKALEQAANAPKKEESPQDESTGKPAKKAKKEAPSIPSSPEDMPLDTGVQDRVALAGANKKVHKDDLKQAPKGKPRKEESKRKTKLTLTDVFEADEERTRSIASIKRAREKAKRQEMGAGILQETEKTVREVIVTETIQVQELANRMAVRSADVVRELMKLGIMCTATQTIDADTAELIVNEFGHKVRRVTDADVENILIQEAEEITSLQSRPPVVTVMGHVDHGKTSLLDALRSTDVVAKEAGGITQHIGAYQIKMPSSDRITFLDTPGHEAFSSMRARGADTTDIVVLVVAADDGIMPQTVEAINHAKAAGVPIIVAINKIDKPEADPKKTRDALLEYELVPEELGGDIMVVEVSAKQKLNLDKLEEVILLQAEMLELKATREGKASGAVIEARLDQGRGVVCTLLVQRGTLQIGDIIIAGRGFGRVRALVDDKGRQLAKAGPSMPVEVLGFNELPSAGDAFNIVDSEKQAREIIDYRTKRARDLRSAENTISVENLFKQAGQGQKELAVIIKGDVQGSVEAIIDSLNKLSELSDKEIRVKVVHSAAGGISESDVNLAHAIGSAIILGFNVRANVQAKELAQNEKVDIRYYSVIYDLVDDMKSAMSGMMAPLRREEFLGNAEILEVFKMSKGGKVAGCMVTEGTVKKGAGVRLIRDGVVIHEGKLKILKRFKDEVNEVKQGTECGMSFENYEDIKIGDTIEAYEVIEEKREL